MNAAAYREYLASDWWQVLRIFELHRAGHCCEFCGDHDCELNVHHLSYARLGDERPADLIVLCSSCHQDAHEFPQIDTDIRYFASRRRPTTSVATRVQRYLERMRVA